MLKKIIIYFAVFLALPVLIGSVNAITYDLFAPQGQLRRGQTVQFTININTEGSTITTGEIGSSYETPYLEYVGITPGAAMTSVVATPQGTGSFLITGTNTAGFNGNDVFAYLDFKIIADSPGSSQLCVLWAPETTPTPSNPPINPTAGPTNPTTPAPTDQAVTPSPTVIRPSSSVRIPTALPKTGTNEPKNFASLTGGFFLLTALGFLILKKVSF